MEMQSIIQSTVKQNDSPPWETLQENSNSQPCDADMILTKNIAVWIKIEADTFK